VGAAALAGVPLLAGFWSKDEILAALHAGSHGPYAGFFGLLFLLAVVTAFLTALYTSRAYFMTFWGEEHYPPEAGEHPHEAPRVMLVPLFVLAACALSVGVLFGPTHLFGNYLEQTPGLEHGESPPHIPMVVVLGVLASLAGIALAWFAYVRKPALPGQLQRAMRNLYELSLNKLYLDELYQALIVGPVRFCASVCRLVDQFIVDGLVDLVGWSPALAGRVFRGVQNGLVQFYALAMILWLAVFVVAMIARWGS